MSLSLLAFDSMYFHGMIFKDIVLIACAAFVHIGFNQTALAQDQMNERGIHAVSTFYGVPESEVEQSESLMREACLVGRAITVLVETHKGIAECFDLGGRASLSVEHRLLASKFRPRPGQYTFLKTEEGLLVQIPSLEIVERACSTKIATK